MTFNINDMRSGLEFGGARNTLFNVQLAFPAGVDTVGAARKISVMARAASLPQTEIGTIPVGYFGRMINVVGDRRYAPWAITIINDEDFKIRQAFEQWVQKMQMAQANIAQYTRPAEYKVDALVNQYPKRGGSPIRTYRFSGMFPSQVGSIETDWNRVDTLEEFQVQLVYDYHETIGGTTGRVVG